MATHVAIRIAPLAALAVALAFTFATHSRAQETPEQPNDLVEQVLAQLTTRDKIGQLLIVGFQGPEPSDEVLGLIAQQHVGGVYINREACNVFNGTNFDPAHCDFPEEANPNTPQQVTGLTTTLQQASCDATTGVAGEAAYCLPLIVSVDHEGDDRPTSRLLNGFTSIPSQMAIGATFDPANAEAVGCTVGREMAAVGVNMLFGPNLDVLETPRSGGDGDQGIRVFGGSQLWVSEMGQAYTGGVHRCANGHVATVAKHFPGHGRSNRNVDYEDIPVVVGKTLEQLAESDLAPFSAVSGDSPGAASITDAMMNSHLSYPGVTGCDVEVPVTFSFSCMQSFMGLAGFDVWRDAGGLTVADDLAAGAVQAYAKRKFGTYLQANVAEEALIAGNDLLPLIRTGQLATLQGTIEHLVGRYESDPQVRARIDDAARRILTLKARLYPNLEPAAVTAAPDVSQIDKPFESDLDTLAAQSLTFIQPDSAEAFRSSVPSPTVGQRILFVECWDDPTCATPNPTDAPSYPPLWPRGKLKELTTELFPGRVSADAIDTVGFSELGAVLRGAGDADVRTAIQEADWIIFAFLERAPVFFPDSEVLKDFLGRGPTQFDLRTKTVAVFAYNSPYHLDAGELRNVDLFIALYSKTEASLRASLRALFHDPAFFRDAGGAGRLPVDYAFGDFVLYDLSEQLEADPSQTVQLAVEPEEPAAGEELTVSLTRALSARNGFRVANGTPVDFVFTLPDETAEEVAATTLDGLASATATISQGGDVGLTLRSGDLVWEAPDPIHLSGGAQPAADGDSGGGFPVLLVVSLSVGIPAVLVAAGVAAFVAYRRRDGGPAEAVPASAEPPPDAVEGELRLDAGTHRVFVNGSEVQPPLSREQYELLAHLYERPGSLCSRDSIIEAVWPEEDATGISEQAVDSLVHRVRERLRAAGATKPLIVTVRGQGFRLDL